MVKGVTAAMDTLTPRDISMVFVKQYYTLLNEAPDHVHRFYSQNSIFVHGGLERGKRSEAIIAQGQKEINDRIQKLQFRDARTKIKQVDAHKTLGNGVVIQVSGQLSNNGAAMRPFMQTFVLAPQTAVNYYVYNDIFRYQDDLFSDDDDAGDGAVEADDEAEPESPPTPVQPTPQPPASVAPPAPDSGYTATAAPHINGHAAPAPAPAPTVAPAAPQLTPAPEPVETSPVASPPPPAAPAAVPEPEPEPVAPAPAPASPQPPRQPSPAPAAAPVAAPRQPSPAPPPPAEPKTYANLFKGASRPAPRPAAPAAAPAPATPAPAAPAPVDKDAGGRPPQPSAVRSGAGEPSDTASGSGDLADRRRREAQYQDSHQIFVGNLPQNITPEELTRHFSSCGNVVDVKINSSKPPPKSGAGPRSYPLYGFVIFDSIAAAQEARSDKALSRLCRPCDDVEHRLNIEEKKTRPGEGRGRGDRLGPGRGGTYSRGGPPRGGRGGFGRGDSGGRGRGGYDMARGGGMRR